ncbi:MAG: PPC domain-containing protein [Deltaproteobacteria bacterium]|jgi:hypothetical protein
MKRSLSILFALTLVHCSGGDDDPIVMIRDSGVEEVEVPRDGGTRDGGSRVIRDAGPRPRDGGFVDDSFDDAIMIPIGRSGGTAGVINPAGDRDFYSINLSRGIYLWIATITEEVNGVITDPVVRLYGPDRQLVAENDARALSSDTDAEIFYHVPADGLYYIEVLEFSDWSPDSTGAAGGPDYLYQLYALELEDDRNGVAIDLERGDDSASRVRLDFDNNLDGRVLGTFDNRLDDRDVFFVSFSTSGRIRFDRMPVGPMGYGSTTRGGNLIVTHVATGSVTANLFLSDDLTSLRVPYGPGDYEFTITHPGDMVGANDFYAFKTDLQIENAPAPPEPNDTPATAPMLTLSEDATRSAFIITDIDDGDADVFAFEVRAGEEPSIACGAQNAGSGVRGLTIELLDPTLTLIGEDAEEPPNNAFIPQTTTSTGVHYVRITKLSQAPGVDGKWVRCGIRSGP